MNNAIATKTTVVTIQKLGFIKVEYLKVGWGV